MSLRERPQEEEIIFEATQDLFDNSKTQVLLFKNSVKSYRINTRKKRMFISFCYEFCGETGLSFGTLRKGKEKQNNLKIPELAQRRERRHDNFIFVQDCSSAQNGVFSGAEQLPEVLLAASAEEQTPERREGEPEREQDLPLAQKSFVGAK